MRGHRWSATATAHADAPAGAVDDRADSVARALAESEARYRMIADRTTDVVVETDATWRITWISPSVKSVLGFEPADVIGLFALEVVAPEDLVMVLEFRDRVMSSSEAVATECRVLTAADEHRWVALHAQAIRHPDGTVRAIVGGFRDCQKEVAFRRAATTLSAANALLVRATDETGLLTSMCDAAVAQGGYRFGWYGRAVGDNEVRFVAQSGIVGDVIQSLVAKFGKPLLGSGPTGQVARSGVALVLGSPSEHPEYQPWGSVMSELGVESSITVPVFVGGVLDGALSVCATETVAFDADAVQVFEDLASQVGAGLSRLRALARLKRSLQDQALFMTAIGQSAEGIIVTDSESRIIYANPAATRSSGYQLDEMVGQTPHMFQSGVHDKGFYDAMWAKLSTGQSFHGVLMNRRKDGVLHEEETTITPVYDTDGELMAFVAVQHDLTQLRELEHTVSQQRDDRGTLVEIMRDVRSSDSVEATAHELCAAVTRLVGIDGAIVLFAHPNGQVLPLGMLDGEQNDVLRVGQAVPMIDTGALMAVSAAGPWWADLHDRTGPAGLFPEVADMMIELGFHATGYAPIRWGGEMVGVLSIATRSADAREWMPARLSVIEELGTFTGMLLGESVMQLAERERARASVQAIIDDGLFAPVFQPIVDITTGAVVGYESLTRFHDGTRPDLRFEEAHRVGLGCQLERACAQAALVAAEALPAGTWLSLNFSPMALIDGTAAATIAGAARPIVVEITEHLEIDSYAVVRSAIEACAPARLAVDDAGSGFASLRHILELEPALVKLDIGLVRGVDHDLARQAMVAGLCHFSARVGTELIAEGVETMDELCMLSDLGVQLVQGYLVGRPAPVEALGPTTIDLTHCC